MDLADAADEIKRKRAALGDVACAFVLFTADDLPELSKEQAAQLLEHFLHFASDEPLYDRLHDELAELAAEWANDEGQVQRDIDSERDVSAPED